MTPQATRTRRLADAVARYAMRVMPDALSHWALAMQSELSYVDDDREALKWAVSCVRSACAARLRHLYLLDLLAVRTAGVIVAACCAGEMTFATTMTVAYRLHATGTTEILARMTPGDDYRRLIPLMEVIPVWLHGLLVTGGGCYVVAIFCLLGRRREAYLVLFLAVLVTVATRTLGRPFIDAAGVVAVPNPSLLSTVLLPIVFPLVLALAAWSGSRRPSAWSRLAG
jgi:hypothetical protein